MVEDALASLSCLKYTSTVRHRAVEHDFSPRRAFDAQAECQEVCHKVYGRSYD